jgi:hypothetical protein
MSTPGSATNPPRGEGWIIQNGTDNDSSNIALVYVTGFDSAANRFNGPAYAINPPRALAITGTDGTTACTTNQSDFGITSSKDGVVDLTGLNYALKCVRCSTSGQGAFCEDNINDRTSIVTTVFTT